MARTVLALSIAAVAAFTLQAQSSVTVFEGGRVIIGDGRVIDNASVVIDGTRIVGVGPAAGIKPPAGAARVSLAGKTLMPALVDTHVHTSTTRDELIKDLKDRAHFGIGAAMSLGLDPGDFAFQVRGENIPGAARFFTAGRGITAPEQGRTDVPYWITTPEQGRKAVQELAAKKVDIVKIWVDTRDSKYRKLTPDIYGPIIDEAHKKGLRVTAHIFDLEDGKGLIRAGVDAFAHGVRDRPIDEEFLALWKQHPNLVLGPNLPDRGVKVDLSWMKPGVSADEYDKLQKANIDSAVTQAFHGIQARNLAVMNKAGARIVLGTDGNRAWGPHEEMEDMVLAGMTPMQVIVAATRNGAEFLRIADAGTLQAGKSADFIVLDANPLDDITNTRRIASVYLRGAAVDRAQPVR